MSWSSHHLELRVLATFKSINVRNLKQLRELHARFIRHLLHQQNYWVTLLIRKCNHVRAPQTYVHLLFHFVPRPNLFLFTSMLKFYSQLGAHHNVLSLFHLMHRHSNLKPDAFVFPLVINASSGKAAVFSVHAHVLKLGHASDRFVRNAVMHAYAKYGLIELAREMFDGIPERTLADWNSMISGYWQCGSKDEACELFNLMPERNIITWTAMVTGYSKCNNLESARNFFNAMPEKNVVSWNAMLSGYAQNGFAEEAIMLFEEMMDDDTGVQPDETTWVTIISSCADRADPRLAKSLVESLCRRQINLNCFIKTALLDMHAKCGELTTARQIFYEMGTRKNIVSWNAMISACARAGDLASARRLFDEMPEKNIISWNSMISGYAQNGQSALAIELFREMTTRTNLKPDEVTMVSVISACGHLGAYESGKWITNFITENQINLSVTGYNSLISMYSRCGCMEDAERIFLHEIPTRDIVSYNSLITGFAGHGYGIKAIELMSKMKEEALEPDRITFIGVLTACSHAGLLAQGQQIFKLIKNPTVDHYACMVDLLGRVGEVDEAKTLVDGMPIKAHAGVYGALLNASRIHRRLDIGEFAANKLFCLEPENSGNYVLLSNMYALAGKWRDVERVRELMKRRGVKKTTGCSWVEFEGRVHRFIAGDQSHQQLEEIQMILEELEKRMRSIGYVANKNWVLRDVEEEEKEVIVGTHSEKLAVGFGLLVSESGTVIRVVKNLRVCGDCHEAIKMISKLTGREILVRDNNRFHCFKDGECSCNDYW